jgi:hypothetical protein
MLGLFLVASHGSDEHAFGKDLLFFTCQPMLASPHGARMARTTDLFIRQEIGALRGRYNMRAVGITAFLILVAGALLADDSAPEPTQRADAPYRLFQTQNIFTFLRLDTRTGDVWQLQWSNQGDDHRFIEPITLIPILPGGTRPGRFTLYPTQNIYNFILLDQEDGRAWQIQWNTDPKKRLLLAIWPNDWRAIDAPKPPTSLQPTATPETATPH